MAKVFVFHTRVTIDQDAFLDHILFRLPWTFQLGLDDWTFMFLSALSKFSNNLSKLVWPEPLIIFSYCPGYFTRVLNLYHLPYDVWSPLWSVSVRILLGQFSPNPPLSPVFPFRNFPSTHPHPAPWLEIPTGPFGMNPGFILKSPLLIVVVLNKSVLPF